MIVIGAPLVLVTGIVTVDCVAAVRVMPNGWPVRSKDTPEASTLTADQTDCPSSCNSRSRSASDAMMVPSGEPGAASNPGSLALARNADNVSAAISSTVWIVNPAAVSVGPAT